VCVRVYVFVCVCVCSKRTNSILFNVIAKLFFKALVNMLEL
jgi:hypothetical protein